MTLLSLKNFRSPAWLFLAFIVLGMLGSHRALHPTSALFMQLMAQEEVESRWRKTKFGWMDSSRWDRPQPAPVERRVELIHPLLLSALLILTSTGFLIWSTEEKYWAEVLNSCTSPRPPDDPNS